jgi:hypothetical protein
MGLIAGLSVAAIALVSRYAYLSNHASKVSVMALR